MSYSYIVTTHDGARWFVLEENVAPGGYVIGFGMLVDDNGEAIRDETGAPVTHSLFLGQAESPTCSACDGRGYIERPIVGSMAQGEVWETAREKCSRCGEPE